MQDAVIAVLIAVVVAVVIMMVVFVRKRFFQQDQSRLERIDITVERRDHMKQKERFSKREKCPICTRRRDLWHYLVHEARTATGKIVREIELVQCHGCKTFFREVAKES